MSVQGMSSEISQDGRRNALLTGYLDSMALVERLHRLLLDVIKDEFERLGVLEINAIQALLLFNIAEHEVTAGELKSRGYYQGSNVSYNLKKLVDLGYIHHQRSEVDRRSVRVRLTDKGRRVRGILNELFQRHAETLEKRGTIGIGDGKFQRPSAADGAVLVRSDPLHLLGHRGTLSQAGVPRPPYQCPVLPMLAQGSAAGSAPPICSNSN